jgi:TATA-box binding protein (TBP) (component of TFIID and TFIIIB)
MVKVKIVNVVATASVNQPMDFEVLRKCKEIFHDSDVYGGRVAYFKPESLQGRVSIFLSGKMISVGTKSEKQAQTELHMAKQFLLDKGFIKDIELYPCTQNLVVTADFEQSLNLEELTTRTRAIYEPEQFPGAILRITQPFKTSVLIFASGKTVITGLKSQSEIDPTINRLQQIIEINLFN